MLPRSVGGNRFSWCSKLRASSSFPIQRSFLMRFMASSEDSRPGAISNADDETEFARIAFLAGFLFCDERSAQVAACFSGVSAVTRHDAARRGYELLTVGHQTLAVRREQFHMVAEPVLIRRNHFWNGFAGAKVL